MYNFGKEAVVCVFISSGFELLRKLLLLHGC
jgi:hypothetical protein